MASTSSSSSSSSAALTTNDFPIEEYSRGTVKKYSQDTDEMSVIRKKVKENYKTINVDEAMENLKKVASPLRLAYAGSIGHPRNLDITAIISKYQTLIHNSDVKIYEFLNAELGALNYYSLAIKMFHEKKEEDVEKAMDIALKIIGNCEPLADNMVTISDTLVKDCTEICNLAEKALTDTTEDRTISEAQKKTLKEEIREYNIKKETTKKDIISLNEAIEQQEEEEKKAIEILQSTQKNAMVWNTVYGAVEFVPTIVSDLSHFFIDPAASGIKSVINLFTDKLKEKEKEGKKIARKLNDEMIELSEKLERKKTELEQKIEEKNKEEEIKLSGEIGGLQTRKEQIEKQLEDLSKQGSFFKDSKKILKRKIEDAEARLKRIEDLKTKLKEDRRRAEKESAKAIANLKNTEVIEINLDTAIKSLHIVVQQLADIKTTFELTKNFWEKVKTRCKALTKDGVESKRLKMASDCRMFDIFERGLNDSGISILALGTITYRASKILNNHVVKSIDDVMRHLPNQEQAKEIIKHYEIPKIE